jgi:hypothetical protein
MCRADVSEWCSTVGIKGKKRSQPVSSMVEFNELLAAHTSVMREVHIATKQMHDRLERQQQQLDREKERWGKLRAHLDSVVQKAGDVGGKQHRLHLKKNVTFGRDGVRNFETRIMKATERRPSSALNDLRSASQLSSTAKRRISLIGGMQHAPITASGTAPLYSAQKFAERQQGMLLGQSHIAERIAAARRAIGYPGARAASSQQERLRATEALIAAHQSRRASAVGPD